MKIKLFLSLILLFFVCVPVFSFAENSTQVIEAGCLDFPPYYEINADTGDVEGIITDFMKQLFARAGIKYNMTMYPPARLYDNLAKGKTNIWLGPAGVATYANKVDVSSVVILKIHLRVYTVGDKPLPKSKAELNGMKLITVNGYKYAGFIRYLTDPANKITLDPSPSHKNVFKKLIMGRAEYALDYKLPSDKVLKSMQPTPDIRFSDMIVIPTYFNINKNTPDAKGLMKKLVDTFHILKAENKLQF